MVKIDLNGIPLLSFSYETVPVRRSELFNIMGFDKTGNLWVASEDGLMKYDGNAWLRFTEKDAGFAISNIKCIAADSKNRLWCGAFGENRHGNGLIMYDGNEWYNYRTANSKIPSDFVGAVNVDCNDVVWMNCRDALYPEVDMYGYGLTSFDGTEWTTYDKSNSGICSDHIYSIEIDPDNTKWLATSGDVGVMSFDGINWRLYDVDNSGIALNTANDITIDGTNDMILFVHPLGDGVSCAGLSSSQSRVEEIEMEYGNQLVGQRLEIYNLQGNRVYFSSRYDGEPLGLVRNMYIIITPTGTYKKII